MRKPGCIAVACLIVLSAFGVGGCAGPGAATPVPTSRPTWVAADVAACWAENGVWFSTWTDTYFAVGGGKFEVSRRLEAVALVETAIQKVESAPARVHDPAARTKALDLVAEWVTEARKPMTADEWLTHITTDWRKPNEALSHYSSFCETVEDWVAANVKQ